MLSKIPYIFQSPATPVSAATSLQKRESGTGLLSFATANRDGRSFSNNSTPMDESARRLLFAQRRLPFENSAQRPP
jgi:hypothetical protein